MLCGRVPAAPLLTRAGLCAGHAEDSRSRTAARASEAGWRKMGV
jgi:hypothetical protein